MSLLLTQKMDYYGFDYLANKKITPNITHCVISGVVVEMAVIETASENSFSELSTSVGYLLRFPRRTADKQAVRFGIL